MSGQVRPFADEREGLHFPLEPGETLASVLDRYDEVAREQPWEVPAHRT